MGLLQRGRVEIITEYETVVRTVHAVFVVPKILRLLAYVRIGRHRKIAYHKREVFKRDGYRCVYCSSALDAKTATIDHVVPRSAGGLTSYDNTVAACSRCNSLKGSKSLAEVGFSLADKPREPLLFRHINTDDFDFLTIIQPKQ